ncbi:MAG TPA: ABC transporter substrate-binding protein [Propionicimonas sp.]|jgi:polar amino acid transport system substrate-binding protein|uniref:ABC transporter substrate-binding protein n=1 Tax=Propionicimonas sp. TaxID=1955623 RepID=UPI002F3F14BF
MTRYFSRVVAVAASAAFALGLAACATGSTPSASPAGTTSTTPSASASVDVKQLTVTPGKLTIATGKPAYSPWVEDDKPESGKGFEAAVAYAVAEKLGFTKDEVVWKRTTFDEAVTPGPKAWDFNLQQFSITDERKKAVDFSSSYYTTSQAVLTYKGSKIAAAASLAELKAAKLGATIGTTSLSALNKVIAPTEAAKVFNNNDDAVLALKNKQIEGLVVDLPTALYLSAAVIDNGTIIGQLADNTGGDQFGLVLQKGSKLTAPVTAAVDALKADNTLATLEKTWLSESISVPVLQ